MFQIPYGLLDKARADMMLHDLRPYFEASKGMDDAERFRIRRNATREWIALHLGWYFDAGEITCWVAERWK